MGETQTLLHLYEDLADAHADCVALMSSDGEGLSYCELHRCAVGILRSLRSRGVRPADRVGLLVPNGKNAALSFLGIASAAACAPLNPGYKAAELEFYLDDIGTRLLVVADHLMEIPSVS